MLNRLKTIIALLRNPKVSKLPKFMVVGALVYLLIPMDVVPDLAPVVGWLDDLLFLLGALSMLFSAAPRTKREDGTIIDVTAEDVTPQPPGGTPK
jgi:uncharacterized membrane protein YkvA (DUF1232 family)